VATPATGTNACFGGRGTLPPGWHGSCSPVRVERPHLGATCVAVAPTPPEGAEHIWLGGSAHHARFTEVHSHHPDPEPGDVLAHTGGHRARLRGDGTAVPPHRGRRVPREPRRPG